MAETDWREILSFSQKELKEGDKDKLCESLSWMEADDIELNFTDLKTLFRLSQDILKYKSEQVNNLEGQLETAQRRIGKVKSSGPFNDFPTKSTVDSVFETIAHQEEVIKANKEILEQLYVDIAELEGRKTKIEDYKDQVDRDSESSRDALSEIDAIAQLENEVTLKNKHIRKLMGDINTLEEENTNVKEKIAVLKDKLSEATQLIENLTEQLYEFTNENTKLKGILSKSEEIKVQLSAELEDLRKELFEKKSTRENICEEIKSKVQHWKNIARSKKVEIEALTQENTILKEYLMQSAQPTSLETKTSSFEESIIKELQEKLSEASNEIIESAKVIESLKSEIKMQSTFDENVEYSIMSDKNESDEGKERIIINKLKKKNKTLSFALKEAEELIAIREKEISKISGELRVIKSEEGLDTIMNKLKSKKRLIKLKDESLKEAIQEINNLSRKIDDLQVENEAIRQKFNLPSDEKIPTSGITKKYFDIEQQNILLSRDIRQKENKLVTMEIEKRDLNTKISKLTKLLNEIGCNKNKIEEILQDSDDDAIPKDGGGESSAILNKRKQSDHTDECPKLKAEIKELSEENEGLRKGLEEIFDYLKDNSTSSSGILALQCPSLERILNSMQARHAAGWFAPHMAAIMELKAAMGSKDALLTALHDARKEIFDIMTQLAKESQKNTELAKKLHEAELKCKSVNENDIVLNTTADSTEFGTWITDKEQEIIDFCDKNQIENIISRGDMIYDNQLKLSLQYFHNKFKMFFYKMTSIAIQAADDKNTWSILEEQYRAEIENLKAQLLQLDDEETSDISPGVIHISSSACLQRKCSYLEDAYKYIRTLNENIKSEYLECKKDSMIAVAEYEIQIQKLMLSVANLTDKLRYSIPIESFWKQNESLNDIIIKHRKLVDQTFKHKNVHSDLGKRLENDKIHVISILQRQLTDQEVGENDNKMRSMLSNIEQTVMSQQIQQLCLELDNKNKEIEKIEQINLELQGFQSKIIDDNLSSITKEEIDLMKDQREKLAAKNKILKEQCQHIEGQLEIALLQLQDSQQNQMNNDLEINMLRHQILDLQSTGDNKAILAKLSGEVLVAHLQATESHKKIERLNFALNKQKEQRVEAEEMLKARQKIFDVYCNRYESKFRYMFGVMQALRQQYQGCLPLTSIDEYLNNLQEVSRKNHDVNEKLDEIEDLRFSLMAKHSVYNQILDVSKAKCLDDEDNCSHKLQNLVMQGIHSREQEHYNDKIKSLEQARKHLVKRCNSLEKILLQVNQGFEKQNLSDVLERKASISDENILKLELEDIQSDDECISKQDQTITLPKPQILKQQKSNIDMTTFKKKSSVDMLHGYTEDHKELTSTYAQTVTVESRKSNQIIQTEENNYLDKLKQDNILLRKELESKNKHLIEAIKIAEVKSDELLNLNKEKVKLEAIIEAIRNSHKDKDSLNDSLRKTVEYLNAKISELKLRTKEESKTKESDEQTKSLISTLENFEHEKNKIIEEYKQLLHKERDEYSRSIQEMQEKINELQSKQDRDCSDSTASKAEALKEATSKYTYKIAMLEDKLFKAQSELDGHKAELKTCQKELDRWKSLASERLSKMEQLNSKLEKRHCNEVDSYKAENEYWLSQLNETQKEHMELRSRLSEQKAAYAKQLSDKDTQIEQLRSVVHGLRTQIMSMQTLISVSDPSFDLTAIVEVDEGSEGMSQPGTERLELKYDSSGDLLDTQDEMLRMPANTSTTIWQEPLIERLRREKQLGSKQNAILRRQIKALAARERRTRLEAQNLKNQIFRISTSGSKVTTAETASLHNKIARLQAQLMNARRDNSSAVALWDKWKRSQQSAERWQVRFEEKCQEIKKLESNLHLTKSAVIRLEKEKRLLLSRLGEVKKDRFLAIEKQDSEQSEKAQAPSALFDDPPPTQALLDRIEAQQRRIAALEVAEKGNEHLVSEFEKALAEITSLKGQVIKLESSLLESQIQLPLKTTQDPQPELEYWKSYCDMLKEENVQLTLRLNAAEPASNPHQHKVNDLEQTVLTLRGLVSKLQSEQKMGVLHKKSDSRPNSSRSFTSTVDKNRSQFESHRIEIANLKRSIQEKDLLLERSKEMLKIAAEREDHLLRENAELRHQLQDMMRHRGGGFLSA